MFYSPIDSQRRFKEKEEEISNLKDKVKELNQICQRLTTHAYAFLGSFDTSNLSEDQKLDLFDFKKVVNSCIKEDSTYKNYLEHKYILKDFYKDPNSDLIQNLCKMVNESFIDEFANDDKIYMDDSDTLEVKD